MEEMNVNAADKGKMEKDRENDNASDLYRLKERALGVLSERKIVKRSELPISSAQRAIIDGLINNFKRKGEFDRLRKLAFERVESEHNVKAQLIETLNQLSLREVEHNPGLLVKDRRAASALLEGTAERSGLYNQVNAFIDTCIHDLLDQIESTLREYRQREIGYDEAENERERDGKTEQEYAREASEKMKDRIDKLVQEISLQRRQESESSRHAKRARIDNTPGYSGESRRDSSVTHIYSNEKNYTMERNDVSTFGHKNDSYFGRNGRGEQKLERFSKDSRGYRYDGNDERNISRSHRYNGHEYKGHYKERRGGHITHTSSFRGHRRDGDTNRESASTEGYRGKEDQFWNRQSYTCRNSEAAPTMYEEDERSGSRDCVTCYDDDDGKRVEEETESEYKKLEKTIRSVSESESELRSDKCTERIRGRRNSSGSLSSGSTSSQRSKSRSSWNNEWNRDRRSRNNNRAQSSHTTYSGRDGFHRLNTSYHDSSYQYEHSENSRTFHNSSQRGTFFNRYSTHSSIRKFGRPQHNPMRWSHDTESNCGRAPMMTTSLTSTRGTLKRSSYSSHSSESRTYRNSTVDTGSGSKRGGSSFTSITDNSESKANSSQVNISTHWHSSQRSN